MSDQIKPRTVLVIDDSVTESKEYEKACSEWGEPYAREFVRKPSEELQEVLAANGIYKKEIEDQISSNPAYQSAKQVIKDFNDSKRERLKNTILSDKLAIKVLMGRKNALSAATVKENE